MITKRLYHLQSPTPPQYVYWQRNSHMINYDDSRRDVSIETTPGPRTQSRLIIREPQISDSGNYTCSASNTEPASIYVFVSKGTNELSLKNVKFYAEPNSKRVYFTVVFGSIKWPPSCLHKSGLLSPQHFLFHLTTYEINLLHTPWAT